MQEAPPAFLQNSQGQLSLPTVLVLIISSMIGAIFFTIAVYVMIVRRFNGHFEAKERVSGLHSSFLEAVEAERNSNCGSSCSSSERSSSVNSSSSSSSAMMEEAEEEDFEEVAIREINSKKLVQQQQVSNKRERGTFASSAREVSV